MSDWKNDKNLGPWEFHPIPDKWGYLNNPRWKLAPSPPVNYSGSPTAEPQIWTPEDSSGPEYTEGNERHFPCGHWHKKVIGGPSPATPSPPTTSPPEGLIFFVSQATFVPAVVPPKLFRISPSPLSISGTYEIPNHFHGECEEISSVSVTTDGIYCYTVCDYYVNKFDIASGTWVDSVYIDDVFCDSCGSAIDTVNGYLYVISAWGYVQCGDHVNTNKVYKIRTSDLTVVGTLNLTKAYGHSFAIVVDPDSDYGYVSVEEVGSHTNYIVRFVLSTMTESSNLATTINHVSDYSILNAAYNSSVDADHAYFITPRVALKIQIRGGFSEVARVTYDPISVVGNAMLLYDEYLFCISAGAISYDVLARISISPFAVVDSIGLTRIGTQWWLNACESEGFGYFGIFSSLSLINQVNLDLFAESATVAVNHWLTDGASV